MHGSIKNATMEINTTIGCKVNCIYCPRKRVIKAYSNNDYDSNKLMSIESFIHFLNKIPKNVRIDFSGMAEPWLNPKCTDMLLYAFNNGYKIAVYTTGVDMMLSDIKKLRSVSYDVFKVHLPDDSERYTNIPHNEEHLNKVLNLKTRIKNISFMVIGNLHPQFEPHFSKIVN